MESKINAKSDYAKLKRKIYVKIITLSGIALIVVLAIRFLARGYVANAIIAFMDKYLNIDYDFARRFYQYEIRNNLDYLIIIAVAVFFVLLCRFLLSQFSKYFNEINRGIDILIRDDNETIRLSPEMATMESHLQTLQVTLSARKRDAELAEQRKNDLVIYLVHDIKTPLTSIIGYLTLLEERTGLPIEEKAEYTHISLEKAYRLEELTNELFEIAQFNMQSIELSKQQIDLYYMLVQLLNEFYPLLSLKGQQAAIHADKEVSLYGDPDKLARVFNNILKNAVTYGNEDSAIDITVETSDTLLIITFKNSGSIDKNELEKVFDKFYRLDISRSSDSGSAGLGLAISKEIISLHGGTIYANSEEGVTTFTIELPVCESDKSEQAS